MEVKQEIIYIKEEPLWSGADEVKLEKQEETTNVGYLNVNKENSIPSLAVIKTESINYDLEVLNQQSKVLDKNLKCRLKNTYSCLVCEKYSPSIMSRQKHFLKHFEKEPLICSVCGKMFTMPFQFLIHFSVHYVKYRTKGQYKPNLFINSDQISRIDLENKDVYSSSDMVPHYSQEHPLFVKNIEHLGTFNDNKNSFKYGKPFKCKNCFKQFAHSYLLKRHSITHTTERPFKCETCSKYFKSKNQLISHSKIHGGKLYMCEICSKQFTHISQYIRHSRIHNDCEKSFRCGICLKQFLYYSALSKHSRIHFGFKSEKSHKCKICLKDFSSKSALLEHFRIHTGQKPFKCKICYRQFNSNSNMKRHFRIHTGEKPYSCKVCLKQFSQSSTLLEHSRIHSGDKFKCEICDKQFSHRASLFKHSKIHVEEKRFQCEICLTPFSNKRSLNMHSRIHTDEKLTQEKPFICEVCFTPFSRKSSLNRHVSKLH